MKREQMVFVGTSDLSGHFRGKSFPVADLPVRLQRGVGIAPTNIFLSALGGLQATPFGTLGEVFLIPDVDTKVCVPFDGSATEYFFLGDFLTMEGTPWAFCPRHVLRRALDRLESETGLRMLAAFEQEFIYSGVPANRLQPYELDAYRRQGVFGETLVAALRLAGVVPEGFLAEFGPQQYEVTVAPALGLKAADDAVITREMTRAVAYRFGQTVSFTPLPDIHGTSNGTHIHWSLVDGADQPVLYDASRPRQMTELGARFIAGVLHHLPALCAITAPSPPSYYRMRPNRFAPLQSDLGALDRGAAVRICPGMGGDPAQHARQFNIEYRVADATASPYLVLGALLQAGLDGIRRGLVLEAHQPHAFPDSLGAALSLLEASEPAAEWLGADLLAGYLDFKRAEIKGLEGLNESEICRRYAEAY